jgi:hypothetical protein
MEGREANMKNSGFVAAGVLVLVVFALLVFNEGKPERDYKRAVRETQTMFDKAHLIGASPKEVTAYLDKNHIEHTAYTVKADPLNKDEKSRTIRMVQRTVANGITFSYGPYSIDLLVFLHFDEHNKLRFYTFDRWDQVL